MIILAIAFLGFSFIQPQTEEVTLKTSAECGECKERIEGKLNYMKGVVFAELDYKTQLLTVKFKPAKITLAEIKQTVAAMGYDIDDVKADPEAQKALPLCCQPGGMKH